MARKMTLHFLGSVQNLPGYVKRRSTIRPSIKMKSNSPVDLDINRKMLNNSALTSVKFKNKDLNIFNTM